MAAPHCLADLQQQPLADLQAAAARALFKPPPPAAPAKRAMHPLDRQRSAALRYRLKWDTGP